MKKAAHAGIPVHVQLFLLFDLIGESPVMVGRPTDMIGHACYMVGRPTDMIGHAPYMVGRAPYIIGLSIFS
ncbi:MAG: hypothetical protein ABS920_05435 [Sporosarcina sp.]